MAQSILIIGGGIVGAALAFRLAADGARVTLLESGEPAGGVTSRAFAWINASGGPAGPLAPLKRAAIPAWRGLQREAGPGLAIDWCGALTWEKDSGATAAMAETRRAEGHSVSLLEGRAVHQLEPGLAAPPSAALFAPEEGALDPVAATRSLLEAAAKMGAVVRSGEPVAALVAKGARVTGVRLRDGAVSADRVVLAAGLGSAPLCAGLDVALPLESSPSIWLAFETKRPLLRRIVSGPDFEARQGGERRLLAAEDYLSAEGDDGPAALAGRAEAALAAGLRRPEGLQLTDFAVGERPMPRDGLPLLGPVPGREGLYLAVMHSGITLAAAVARIAAQEILRERPSEVAQPFRIARFHT